MLIVIIILEILITSGIFFLLGYKSFKGWKSHREESLIHITIFFFAIGFLILAFSLAISLADLNSELLPIEIRLLSDTIYNLFYLEISIFYLSIFTNARTHFESYAPMIIGFSTLMALFAGISRIDTYYEVSTIFHFFSLVITIILIFLGIKHINNSKNYVNNDAELKFLSIITKVLKIMPIALFIDLVFFINYLYNPLFISRPDEFLLFIFFSLGLVSTIIGYFGIMNFAKKTKEIDIITLLNTIS